MEAHDGGKTRTAASQVERRAAAEAVADGGEVAAIDGRMPRHRFERGAGRQPSASTRSS
jgi:hypothetical protein